jgi:hypothetical protein
MVWNKSAIKTNWNKKQAKKMNNRALLFYQSKGTSEKSKNISRA